MQYGEEIEGVVSLWVGHADSLDALLSYTDMDYTNADSNHLSPFAVDFGTGWYDEDFMEVELLDKPSQFMRDVLRGFSYDNLLIPKFVELSGEWIPEEVNAVVLLYNFQHNGIVKAISGNAAVRLCYMGSITVVMPWPD